MKYEVGEKCPLISHRWRAIVGDNGEARVGAPNKCTGGTEVTLSATLL